MMGAIGTEERGITPRMVETIFEAISSAPPNLEFTVRVSYVEIYLGTVVRRGNNCTKT